MASFFFRIFELLAILWLVRLFMRILFGGVNTRPSAGPFNAGAFSGANPGRQSSGQERVVIGGEMKKDPQCGMYVSTELSIKHNAGKETLHFCSTECEQEYLRSASGKSA